MLVIATAFTVVSAAHADPAIDHDKTRFPLTLRHATVACESCHPPAASGRVWRGVPLDCHGCHGDRRNHKGALGTACNACHDASGWKSIRHTAAQHTFALVGRHALPCASCHAGGKHLTPDVKACAECHAQPHAGTTDACETCHVGADWKAVDFHHAKDPAALGGKHRKATCLGCHPSFHFKGTTFECESCHRKDEPHELVGPCKTCHPAQTWAQVELAPIAGAPPPRYAVTPAFDHLAHGRAVIGRGLKATCEPCHTGADKAHPTARPAMASCEGCHDGARAFSALGTQCADCHRAASEAPRATQPATARPFRHDQHEARHVDVATCTTCHGVGSIAKDTHPGRTDHKPCAGCHVAEFESAPSWFCTGCHANSDPLAPNPVRTPTPSDEWQRGTLPHGPHVAADLACARCHPSEAGVGDDPSTRPNHAFCGTCHAVGSGQRTTLAQCASCHVRASVERPRAQARPWSTRAMFRHDTRHLTAGCDACHRADGKPELSPPTMVGCESCHNGQRAFKATGFGCPRCHRDRVPEQ